MMMPEPQPRESIDPTSADWIDGYRTAEAEYCDHDETIRMLKTERDFWKDSYDTQHRKVHEMEDVIAKLRSYLRLALEETTITGRAYVAARQAAGLPPLDLDYGPEPDASL